MDNTQKIIVGILVGVSIGLIIYAVTRKTLVVSKEGVPSDADVDKLIASANAGGSDTFQDLKPEKMKQVRGWIKERLTKLEVEKLIVLFGKRERDMNAIEKDRMTALLSKMLGKTIKA